MDNHLRSVTLLQERFPTKDYYPFTLPIFHQTRHLSLDSPVTLFVGENGAGKSTLLEALAHACGVHIWRMADVPRRQVNLYEKELYRCLKVDWADGRVDGGFFGSDIFKDFTHLLEEWAESDPGQLAYFGGKSLVTQSHGQSMMSYFRARYKIRGLYLLDEPETALSPRSQLELLEILEENSQSGHAQFIIATHSPILLACARATIYSFDYATVQPVRYEETEHYQVYRRFLLERQSHPT